MLEKVKKAFGKCKAFVIGAVAAVSTAAMAAVASAEEAVSGSSVDTTSMMKEAGDQLTAQFSSMVTTIIPVILGILGSGLVIFGIFALIRLAKKIFCKVAG